MTPSTRLQASSIVVVRQVDQLGAQRSARRQTRQAEAVHSCYEAGPFGDQDEGVMYQISTSQAAGFSHHGGQSPLLEFGT
jgi:hypothetical protein